MILILLAMIATASLSAFSAPVRVGPDAPAPLTLRTPPDAKPTESKPAEAKPAMKWAVLRLTDQAHTASSTAASPSAPPFQTNLPRGSVLNLKV